VSAEDWALRRPVGRSVFGRDARGYAAGRPDYPPRVYEVLVERCGLGPGTGALEVGPGTGLVTAHLLDAGARVVAVEPDPGMAEHLAAAHPGALEIVVSPLEDAELPEGAFDLAVAATSFHWVDQEPGLRTLGAALRPGGWAAIFWNLYGDPRHDDDFTTVLGEILGPKIPADFDEPGRPPFQLDDEHRRRDLTTWAGLDEVTSELIEWTCPMTAEATRALYASVAPVLLRPPDEQARVLDAVAAAVRTDFGGLVERRFLTPLYTGRRV